MVRANGSYPLCPGFESLHRHHPLLKRFRAALKRTPIGKGGRLLLAVSGGKDSMGMMALFVSALPRPPLELGVIHVNHALRGAEAKRDADMVQEVARQLGLRFYCVQLRSKPKPGQSVEEWARERRYAAFEKTRREGGWDYVATAHTLDDQAETVLMRIARGTGIGGLSGIHPESGRVLRPVLDFTGDELGEAARLAGLRVVEDSSNLDTRFARNRIRHEVMPVIEKAFPGFKRHLAALARHARFSAAACAPDIAQRDGEDLYFPLGELRGLAEGEARRQVLRGLALVRGDARRITERHVEALCALSEAPVGARVALPGAWEGVRERSAVRLRKLPKGGQR